MGLFKSSNPTDQAQEILRADDARITAATTYGEDSIEAEAAELIADTLHRDYTSRGHTYGADPGYGN